MDGGGDSNLWKATADVYCVSPVCRMTGRPNTHSHVGGLPYFAVLPFSQQYAPCGEGGPSGPDDVQT